MNTRKQVPYPPSKHLDHYRCCDQATGRVGVMLRVRRSVEHPPKVVLPAELAQLNCMHTTSVSSCVQSMSAGLTLWGYHVGISVTSCHHGSCWDISDKSSRLSMHSRTHRHGLLFMALRPQDTSVKLFTKCRGHRKTETRKRAAWMLDLQRAMQPSVKQANIHGQV